MGARRKRGCDPELELAWRGRMRRWRSSGRSVREFCRREGVPETAFYYWRRELQRRSGFGGGRGGRSAGPLFVPVRVSEGPGAVAAGVLEVRLPSGHVLRGAEPEKLARLAVLLGSAAC